MKRLARILAINLIVFGIVTVFICDFIKDDAIHYFTDRPQRLLDVAAIAIVGAALVWAFSCLPIAFRRGLALSCRYVAASVVAYLFAWGGAFIYLCHASGTPIRWNNYWVCLFLAWSSHGNEVFNFFFRAPDGSRLLDHAWLYSVMGSIPLAVSAVALVRRLGREKQDAAQEANKVI